MQVDVNGTRLWFDVDGPSLVPDGPIMATRPTVILLHGGPGSYDHSYFKPDFAPLTRLAQVVYLDLRDHGRSARHDPANWTFEVCADDVRAFCDALGDRPADRLRPLHGRLRRDALRGPPSGPRRGARPSVDHGPVRPRAARRGLPSLWRRRGGRPGQARLRRRPDHRRGVGPGLRRVRAAGTGSGAARTEEAEPGGRTSPGWSVLRRFDVVDQLARVDCPTLVCVGELDPVTPVDAVARDRRRAAVGASVGSR